MRARYIVSILCAIVLISGCTKILNDFEFEDKDPKIVVQAKVNPDSVVRVLVTRSVDMFDERVVNGLSKATVNLYTEEGNLISFRNDTNGWYSLDPGQIESGKNYRLEIEAENYPKASSEFYIPLAPTINRIDTSKIREIGGSYYWGPSVKGKCTLHFADNPETEDYYIVSVKRRIPEFILGDSLEPEDTIYNYAYSDISSTSPYLEVVYQDFYGYQRPNSGDNWNIKKLVFSDKLFNGKADVSIDILFNPDNKYNDPGNPLINKLDTVPEEYIDVFFTAVDKHFYEFAKTKAEINRAEGNPLAEPVTPYSTVTDGFGLVYGLAESKTVVDITGLFTEDDLYGGGGY